MIYPPDISACSERSEHETIRSFVFRTGIAAVTSPQAYFRPPRDWHAQPVRAGTAGRGALPCPHASPDGAVQPIGEMPEVTRTLAILGVDRILAIYPCLEDAAEAECCCRQPAP